MAELGETEKGRGEKMPLGTVGPFSVFTLPPQVGEGPIEPCVSLRLHLPQAQHKEDTCLFPSRGIRRHRALLLFCLQF